MSGSSGLASAGEPSPLGSARGRWRRRAGRRGSSLVVFRLRQPGSGPRPGGIPPVSLGLPPGAWEPPPRLPGRAPGRPFRRDRRDGLLEAGSRVQSGPLAWGPGSRWAGTLAGSHRVPRRARRPKPLTTLGHPLRRISCRCRDLFGAVSSAALRGRGQTPGTPLRGPPEGPLAAPPPPRTPGPQALPVACQALPVACQGLPVA